MEKNMEASIGDLVFRVVRREEWKRQLKAPFRI